MTKGRYDQEHVERVRHKILNTAKYLFGVQGYRRTTIRQIVEQSGVLTGSIYYLYKNKEDVFQALILSLTQNCIVKIREHCGEESPVFQYAAVCAVELCAVEENPVIRDNYATAYSSPQIFEHMVEQYADMADCIFRGTPWEKGKEARRRQALLIKGMMGSCVSAFYFQRMTDHETDFHECVRGVLEIMGIGSTLIEYTMKQIDAQKQLWISIGHELRDYPV